MDQSLEDIQHQLDSNCFYRVNRSFVVSFSAFVIEIICHYHNSKLLVASKLAASEDIVVVGLLCKTLPAH